VKQRGGFGQRLERAKTAQPPANRINNHARQSRIVTARGIKNNTQPETPKTLNQRFSTATLSIPQRTFQRSVRGGSVRGGSVRGGSVRRGSARGGFGQRGRGTSRPRGENTTRRVNWMK